MSYKPQFKKSVLPSATTIADSLNTPLQTLTTASSKPVHTIYLIGDAGGSPEDEVAKALQQLEKKLAKAGKNSSVIFLGDNIYQHGLPRKEHPERELAEHRILAQLGILDNFKGDPYFIPGNHDWYADGLPGVIRQEKFVEKHLNRGNVFYPDNGCGGPEVIEISDEVVLIMMDSHWWVANWDKYPDMNEGCESRNRAQYIANFKDILKDYRDRRVVVAMHHPLYTKGSHGGQFPVKDHIFPLTAVNKYLYLPLPIVGTVLTELRSTIGIPQDVNHPLLAELKQEILTASSGFDNVLFVAGHDHNLQMIEAAGHPFIVSGAGSKETPAKVGGEVLFSYGQQGFVQLDFYENGTVWGHFFGAGDPASDPELLFSHQIFQPQRKEFNFNFAPTFETKDSTETILYGNTDKSKLYRFLWGDLYRDVYRLNIKVPVLNLAEQYGGLFPIKKGGGMQTNSLRLSTEDGKQFVMRDMQKDPNRLMGGMLKGTFVAELITDLFTVSHPYAAFAIPPMADAVGIYHTNPKLYYIPKQPALGKYNDNFGDALYLFEERPDEAHITPSFGNSKKITSTPKVIQKIQKNHKHFIDQAFVVRSRLFDMTIGDWDRHEDQWRWAAFEAEEDSTYYRPIPRDRDQPFSKFDGLLMNILNKTIPLVKNFQSYGPTIPSIKWYNSNARFFDRIFLNQLSWEDWEREIRHIQTHLTDDIVDTSFKIWPESVHQLSGIEIATHLKGRRDNLMKIGRDYYEKLSKKVDVYGTNKSELFQLERRDSGTLVKVYGLKKGKTDHVLYERFFKQGETKEINLYGLDGKDLFELSGSVKKGMKVRAIGGRDEDTYKDESRVRGLSRKTLIYDYRHAKSNLELGKEAKDKRSDRYGLNEFDYKDNDENYRLTLPLAGFNPDDGILVGAYLSFYRYGFKKEPFASKNSFGGTYAFRTGAGRLRYSGEFTEALGRWDLVLNTHWESSQFVVNFFGLGNETVNSMDNLSFNRVRKGSIGFFPTARKTFRSGAMLELFPLFESQSIERTPNRFITSEDANLEEGIFENQYYAGGVAKFSYTNLDAPSAPTKGFNFLLETGWKANLEKSRDFGYINWKMGVYQRLTYNGALVLATQIGGQSNFGTFEFFQAATIGGTEHLRGFRQQRFAGEDSFFHTTDLRWRLKKNVRTYFAPLTFGLMGSFDYGRVWIDDEDSNTWHHSFGGGLWINTLDLMTLSLGYHRSTESDRFIIAFGFNF